ncbi:MULTISPECIES: hypothetical protein [unclassified Streptomyces]|uniref:hypothetical protein n=1 Tax=unclassified Streptomyces TaxID=2593676 RepID=UPI00278C2DA6|nr:MULTISPECIES: hypothetical protein [unclassified Streptomyces]
MNDTPITGSSMNDSMNGSMNNSMNDPNDPNDPSDPNDRSAPDEMRDADGRPRLLPSDERPQGAPARYTLNYPSTWSHLDLDPSTRDVAIRRRVEEEAAKLRAKGKAVDRDLVDELIRGTRRSAREAYARGALQIASLIAFLSDGNPLSATALVLRTRIPEGESTDLGELMLTGGIHVNRTSPGRGSELNQVHIMELPEVGSVGRLTTVEDFDHGGPAPVRTAVHQVVIPVPSSRDLMVLASTTPNINMAETFFEVFDAIAGTFRFHESAEPEAPAPSEGSEVGA